MKLMYNPRRAKVQRVYSRDETSLNLRIITMATSGKRTDSGSAKDSESEVNLAGWDPYIVALTADGRRVSAAKSPQQTAASAPAETRELGLMDWLRTHEA